MRYYISTARHPQQNTHTHTHTHIHVQYTHAHAHKAHTQISAFTGTGVHCICSITHGTLVLRAGTLHNGLHTLSLLRTHTRINAQESNGYSYIVDQYEGLHRAKCGPPVPGPDIAYVFPDTHKHEGIITRSMAGQFELALHSLLYKHCVFPPK